MPGILTLDTEKRNGNSEEVQVYLERKRACEAAF